MKRKEVGQPAALGGNPPPVMIRGENVTAVRVEREGFVFIARLLPRYNQLPGFRSLELYKTVEGREKFYRYATTQEICELFPALQRMVKEALREEDNRNRRPSGHYSTRGGTRVDANGYLVSTGEYVRRAAPLKQTKGIG